MAKYAGHSTMPYQKLNISLLFWIPTENGKGRNPADMDIAKFFAKALGKISLGQGSHPEKTTLAGGMTLSPRQN